MRQLPSGPSDGGIEAVGQRRGPLPTITELLQKGLALPQPCSKGVTSPLNGTLPVTRNGSHSRKGLVRLSVCLSFGAARWAPKDRQTADAWETTRGSRVWGRCC